MQSRRFKLVAMVLVVVVAASAGLVAYHERPTARFVRNLNLAAFSTSMLKIPSHEQLQQKAEEADRLGVDLFAAYTANQKHGTRYSLAWLLISRESAAYLDFVGSHITTVPWPEVRIWRVTRRDEALSPAYRDGLVKVMLASPTSEGRLAAVYWYKEAGRMEEAETACLEALACGPSFDSRDAAYELADSKRCRKPIVRHLLSMVRSEHTLAPSAASQLAAIYGATDQIAALLQAFKDDPSPETRRPLVEALEKLAGSDATDELTR